MTDGGVTLDQVLSVHRTAREAIVNVDEPVIKLVIFQLQAETFAFAAETIREILAEPTIFQVPGCPPALEGVINVRGDIESVLGLGALLGLPAIGAGTGSASQILLGQAAGLSSGIRVDRVLDVADIPRKAIQPPPSVVSERLRPAVVGVFSHLDRPVILLDLGRILEDYARAPG